MSSSPVPYNTMLAALDAVEVTQRRKSTNDAKRSVTERRAALLEEIGGFYQRQGLTVDSSIIEQGVDEFLSSELEFLPPKNLLLFGSAVLWIKRKVVLLSMAGISALLILGGFVNSTISVQQGQELHQIVKKTEAAQASLKYQAESLHELIQPVQASGHPQIQPWVADEADLQKAFDFWQKEASDTLSEIRLARPSGALDLHTHQRSKEIAQYNQRQQKLAHEADGLGVQTSELKARARFYTQYSALLAELNAHQAGTLPTSLNNRLSQATDEARRALDAGNQFAYLQAMEKRSSLTKLGEQATAISKEVAELKSILEHNSTDPVALRECRAISASIENDIATGKIDTAQKTVNQLRDYIDFVRANFVLRIVNRPGVKSGIDRYYTDKSGRRIAGYYLIVEATDSTGRTIKQPIRNEENGTIQLLSMWGERVSKDVYENVKADKLDNGRIDRDKVGEKSAGAASIHYTLIPKSEGRITRW